MAATPKKKKPVNDFELPDAEDIELLKQERAASAERIARFEKDFEPTGSAFKDTAALSGTSRDVKRIAAIDSLLSRSADRQATTRAQDIQYDLGVGEIEVNKERNRITEKGYDQHREVGMGEIQLNRDIFDSTKERYDKYGEPLDKLGVARAAAGTQATFDDLGYEMPTVLEEFRPKYVGGESVAKPEPYVDENSIYYNKPYAPKPSPIAAAVSDIGTMLTTGPSDVALPYAGMSIGKKAGEGLVNLFRPKPRNKVRGKVRRVN